MDSSVSAKDEIWFLCVFHHVSMQSTYLQNKTAVNPEENNIQLFQVARGFSRRLYTVTDSNLCLLPYRHYVWNGEFDGDIYHSSEYG
jgi:hypothetical protein